VSGSYRLGVSDETSDIDTVVVASHHCGSRTELLIKIHQHFENFPHLTELQLIDQARIPLVSFTYKGTEFDVALACVVGSAHESIYHVKGIDASNELSLGGPRHTEFILQHAINHEVFAQVLKLVRQWAKNRQIYGAKFGFLGGVSWAIMISFICHRDCSSVVNVLRLFFGMYSSWNWKRQPVTLSDLSNDHFPQHFSMAIMTPVHPVINSSQTVNQFSVDLFREEFSRAVTMIRENKPWDEIVTPTTRKTFLRRWPYRLTSTYDDTSDNGIVAAKWLKLSYIMSKYPYHLKSVLWPHAESQEGKIKLYMCADLINQPVEKGSVVNLSHAVREWLDSFPSKIDIQLNIKKVKSKK